MYHAAVTNIPVALTTMLIALLCVSDHRAAAAAPSAQAATAPTAAQIVERIKSHVGVPWQAETVDTFKAGDPDTRVTGVAVTMMATLDVLQRAVKAGRNLVITHEPTFYDHQDPTEPLEQARDTVFAAKMAFIRDHHLVVWRFHDHWHRRQPDGVQAGVLRALGWNMAEGQAPEVVTRPETTPPGSPPTFVAVSTRTRCASSAGPTWSSRRSRSLLAPRGSRATAKRSSAPTSRCS